MVVAFLLSQSCPPPCPPDSLRNIMRQVYEEKGLKGFWTGALLRLAYHAQGRPGIPVLGGGGNPLLPRWVGVFYPPPHPHHAFPLSISFSLFYSIPFDIF